MYIEYGDKKLKRALEDERKLTAQYGAANARKICRRLNEIEAAETLGMMVQYRIGRCHPLSGNRQGQFALDLEHPFRLIMVPVYEPGGVAGNWQSACRIRVLEVTDYHE